MAIDRKSSIRKAPAADVVDVLTSGTETRTSEPDLEARPSADPKHAQSPSAAIRRPGPGRPRSKRRMEPFSSKIEIDLRDELDEYIDSNDITIIDFLDEAIRDRLKK